MPVRFDFCVMTMNAEHTPQYEHSSVVARSTTEALFLIVDVYGDTITNNDVITISQPMSINLSFTVREIKHSRITHIYSNPRTPAFTN